MCKDDRSVNYERPSTYSGSCNNWNNSENALPVSSAQGRALGRRHPHTLKYPSHPVCPSQTCTTLSEPSFHSPPVCPPAPRKGELLVWGEKVTLHLMSISKGTSCYTSMCHAEPQRQTVFCCIQPKPLFLCMHELWKTLQIPQCCLGNSDFQAGERRCLESVLIVL